MIEVATVQPYCINPMQQITYQGIYSSPNSGVVSHTPT